MGSPVKGMKTSVWVVIELVLLLGPLQLRAAELRPGPSYELIPGSSLELIAPEWPRLTTPEVATARTHECDAKCGALPGSAEAGETRCEWNEDLPRDQISESFTGKVITKIFDENPCTRPIVELHEWVHAAMIAPICRSTDECLKNAGSNGDKLDKCLENMEFMITRTVPVVRWGDVGEVGVLTVGLECSAYKISENYLRERVHNTGG
jgi:hypothetical protein